jgi:hypothetical protein
MCTFLDVVVFVYAKGKVGTHPERYVAVCEIVCMYALECWCVFVSEAYRGNNVKPAHARIAAIYIYICIYIYPPGRDEYF